MSRKNLLFLIIILLILAVGWLVGRHTGIVTFGKGPCADDKLKFCKSVAPSGIRDCLKEHTAELSETCRTKQMARAKEKEAKTKGKNPQD